MVEQMRQGMSAGASSDSVMSGVLARRREDQ